MIATFENLNESKYSVTSLQQPKQLLLGILQLWRGQDIVKLLFGILETDCYREVAVVER